MSKSIEVLIVLLFIEIKGRDYDATEYYGYSLMYFIDTPINNGNREQTKQGILRSPVGAIAPGGSSCVSIFKKRIIGTAI
jgi:hypothetical protein